MYRLPALILILTFILVGHLAAATITVGLPSEVEFGNCMPFGCPILGGATFTEYQQIYSSAVFASPVSISQLSFFKKWSIGNVQSATYTFRLSTTSKAMSGLSNVLSENIGLDNTEFFSGVLSGPIPGGILTVSGQPFYYDPSAGNLLLDILISNATNSGTTASFERSDGTAGTTYRAFASNFGSYGQGGPGLITQFTYAPVPEPGTALLLSTALLALAMARPGARKPARPPIGRLP